VPPDGAASSEGAVAAAGAVPERMKPVFLGVEMAAANPYHGTPGEVIDPTKVDVYRGGTDLTVKPGEVKIDPLTGLVQPTHGLSLETDPSGLARFGGAHKVKSIPNELRIMQRGKRHTHFELVPKQPMTPARFQDLVKQVVLE
jgi:hypothetical protein